MDDTEEPAPELRLIDRVFRRPDITAVRHAVAVEVSRAGLGGDRLDGFVLAVNEIVTNAVLHAGGQGRIRLWIAGGSVHCEIADRGPGIPERRLADHTPPALTELGGRGIWLARQLCDSITVTSGGTGSTVTVVTRLSTSADRPERPTEAAVPGP